MMLSKAIKVWIPTQSCMANSLHWNSYVIVHIHSVAISLGAPEHLPLISSFNKYGYLLIVWLSTYIVIATIISMTISHRAPGPEHVTRCYLMPCLEGDRLRTGAALDLLGGEAALGGAFKGLLLE